MVSPWNDSVGPDKQFMGPRGYDVGKWTEMGKNAKNTIAKSPKLIKTD